MENQNQQQMQIKIDDAVLKGVYANALQVGHTKEEFILDFMNLVPPQGIAVSRVFLSPGHMKRIVSALQDNLKKYEEQFGKIEEAQAPKNEQKLGFNA
jgi:hypothetical protein